MPSRPARPKVTCTKCGATIRPKDRFCPSCGTPVAAAQAPRPHAPPSTSASLQAAGSADDLQEQRKVVTVLFADLSGSTPLAEKLDPEELRVILGSYFGALARQIQRYEGTIDKYIGDAVMAVFGAPISHEDDAERAVHAALAMQASIVLLNDDLDRKYGVRLSLRIGVNTGEVVAGMLAGDVQRAYTVVGDAVNTAQRLESAAPLGQVLVSETTRRLALHRFEFERREPVMLKGKSEPVITYRAVRELDVEVEPDATPFVGRREQLARLASALADARAGRGQVLHVVGEPGVGKSRLVAELRATLPVGTDRMTARCVSYEQSTPYALIADFIRGAFGIHAADAESAADAALTEGLRRYGLERDDLIVSVILEVVGYPPRSTLDPERKRAILVGFLREVLRRTARRAPFVLVAEDLHWVDDASVRVLTELVAEAPSLPCVFATTSRGNWTPPWPAERIELAPFDDAASREFVQAVLQLPPEVGLADSVLARTGGNPFFIEEIIRELRTAGSLVERDGLVGSSAGATDRLPATVQEVLEARLDRFDDATKRVVRPAAVIGRTFWYRVLVRMLPSLPVAEAIGLLEQEGVLTARASVPELTYGFRQVLIRDVAYQTQLQSVRRTLHRAVGEAYEALFTDRLDDFVDVLAFHYDRSDERAKALYWLVRAADRAAGLFANDEALAQYTSALARAEDDDGPLGAAAILERIGEVQTLVGRYDDAVASFTTARGRVAPLRPPVAARLHRRIAIVRRAKGEYDHALTELDQAKAELGDPDDVEAGAIDAEAGMVRFLRGEFAAARECLMSAVANAELNNADPVRAQALKLLGSVAHGVGQLREAVDRYRESVAIYERLGDLTGVADVRSNIGQLYRRMGQWEDSLAEYRASLALRERIGHQRGIAASHNNIGEVYRTRGEPKLAIPEYERAIRVLEAIGAAADAAVVQMNLGSAKVESDDIVGGLEALLQAQASFAALGRFKFLPELHRVLASAALREGDLVVARQNAERSLELARADSARHEAAMTERVLGEIALASGRRAEAQTLLERSRETLAELGETAELGRTEALLERLRTGAV
ncbi:MAG TPA: adenylate/guanylate cyclase domain-containing protein [Candidatus Limnocylindria bacterium]